MSAHAEPSADRAGRLAGAATPHATLIVLRHGESVGNADGTFAGWRDVALTARGEAQAAAAAATLADLATPLHAVFTSRLTRAVSTANIVLAALGATAVPRVQDWRLNERHCGALQGRAKADCKREFGRDWLRSLRSDWHVRPPLAAAGGPDDPRQDARYAEVAGELPRGESFADLAARVAPVWDHELAPRLRAGACVLVVGHGLALRALLRPLEGIADDRLPDWMLANAAPRTYRLAADLRVLAVTSAQGDSDSDE